MNKLNAQILILLLVVLLACKSSGPNSPEENADYSEQLEKYFPYNIIEQYEFCGYK